MFKISEKMNVLFIMTDQQRANHLGCSGNSILKTPNIDKLASEGVRFTNVFCTNPYCMPNRATLLTGLYPNVNGVRSNGMILSEDIPTITKTLGKAGWRTAAFGKLHHQFNTAPFRTEYKSTESFYSWVFPPDKFYPVLENPKEKIRDCCLIEHDDEVGPIQARVRHLVTEDFKLTVYEWLRDFGEIYDLKNDPHELHNLW